MPEISPSYVTFGLHSLDNYLDFHVSKQEEVLYELYRETHLQTVNPRMLSGHIQGRFLKLMTHLAKAERVLEIGTFTGYSAICMAMALPKNGKLHTIEKNDELESIARKYFQKSGLDDKIHLHIGDACTIIPTINEEFDLVFMDGDKMEYWNYYELCLPKLKKGGVILADNVLWSGKVLETDKEFDKHTAAVDQFNKKITEDIRVENFILPVRDGIMCITKK
jgi:predicted O-methyltransferase YrrM